MVMGKEGPLLTCMVVEVLGAVWMVEVVPGRLVTVNAGFNESYTQSRDGAVSLTRPCPCRCLVWTDSPDWNQGVWVQTQIQLHHLPTVWPLGKLLSC